MIRSLAGAAALFLLAASPVPQELQSDVLDKVKNATVYVVVEKGRSRGVGTGFLFMKREMTGYVITCEHVVGQSQSVKVVFWSGTSLERSYPAEVVASDASRDLACLVLKDVKDLPIPLDLGIKTGVKETETVFAAGFPFGKALAAGDKNPEISVSKSSISSIRKNTDGDIVAVQMSGEVNPGNSGGPLVTTTGMVVGVIASKVGGTGTAFAVPAEEIQTFLRGRARLGTFRKMEGTVTKVSFEVTLDLIDPMATLKSAGVAYIDEEKVKSDAKPNEDGKWSKVHPDMKVVDFKIENGKAARTLDFTRTDGEAKDRVILYQCYFTGADGQVVWTKPGSQTILFEGGKEPASDPGPEASATEPGPDLAVPDELTISTQLKLNSVIADLFFAPDGSALYALDLSEGMVYKINPDTLTITSRVETMEHVVAMAMTPNGKTLYVAGSHPQSQQASDASGSIQVIPTSTMKTSSTFEIKHSPAHIVATDAGAVLISCQGGSSEGLVIIDPLKKNSEVALSDRAGSTLRLAPDQGRAYFGDMHTSPGDYRCLLLRKDNNRYVVYDSPYHGKHDLGREFEISPDGRYLLGGRGAILRLSRSREGDLTFISKIEPWTSLAMAKGSQTMLATTPEGFLKVYRLGDFELLKTAKIDRYCSRTVLDVPRMKIHAVASPSVVKERHGIERREKRVAHIVSFSLAEK